MVIEKRKSPLNCAFAFVFFFLSAISGKVFLGGEENQTTSGTSCGGFFLVFLWVFFHFFGRLVSLVLLHGNICLNWRNTVLQILSCHTSMSV